MSLVTVGDFAGYLRRDLDPFDTHTAQSLLDAAEGLVTEYCGWHIGPTEQTTLTVDGSGLPSLALPTMNLIEVVAVTEDGRTIDPADLTWSAYGVVEKPGGAPWITKRRGVVVEVIHGYDPVPYWVQSTVFAAAGRAFLGSIGVIQEAAGGESVTYAQPAPGLGGAVVLMPQEKQMLNRLAVQAA